MLNRKMKWGGRKEDEMTDNNVLEDNVKRLIDSVGPELHLPDETKSRILEKLRESGARAGTAEQRRSTWRIITESGIGRLAAAVIIVAALVGIYQLGSRVESVALGDVYENMKKMPWTKVEVTTTQEPGGEKEVYHQWYDLGSKKMFTKRTAYVRLSDLAEQKDYNYRFSDNTLRIKKLTERFFWADSIIGYLDELVEALEGDGWNLTQRRDKFGSVDVEVFQFSISSNYRTVELVNGTEVSKEKMELIADRKNKLLIAINCERLSKKDEVLQHSEWLISYPESGPKDIYALGVPANAKVVAQGMEPEVLLAAELKRAEAMFAAGDIDGLVAMLSDDQFRESKLLAADYLAKIGDARAIGVLELLDAQSDDPDNPFGRAAATIKNRLEQQAPKTQTKDDNDVNAPNLVQQEPNVVKLPTAVNITGSGSKYDHFLFTRRDGAEGQEGTKTLVLGKVTAEGFELRDIHATPEFRYPWEKPLCAVGGILYGTKGSDLFSVNLATSQMEVLSSAARGSVCTIIVSYIYADGRLYGIAPDEEVSTLRVLDFNKGAYRDICTLESGWGDNPTISPDHKHLAYFVTEPNGFLLTVVDVDSGQVAQPSEPIGFVVPSIASTFYAPPLIWVDAQRVLCIRTEVMREDPNSLSGGEAMHKLTFIHAVTGKMEDILVLPGNPYMRFCPALIQDYIGVGPRVHMLHGDLGDYRLDLASGKLVEDDTVNGDYGVSDGYLFQGEKELGPAERDHVRVSPDAKRAIWFSGGELFYHDVAQEAPIPVTDQGEVVGALMWFRDEDLQARREAGQTPAGWRAFGGRPHREPVERTQQVRRLPRNHISHYLSATVVTDKQAYRLYEPVLVTVILTNISGSDLKVLHPVVFDSRTNHNVDIRLDYPGGSRIIEYEGPCEIEEEEIVLKAGESVSAADALEVPLVGDYKIEFRYEGQGEQQYRGGLMAGPITFRVDVLEDPEEERRLLEGKFARLMEQLRRDLEVDPNYRYANSTVGNEITGMPGMGPKVAPYIMEVLQYEKNPTARELLWRPLVFVAGPESLPFFVDRLMQGEAERTCEWLYALHKRGQEGSEEAFAALLAAMKHENADIRRVVSGHLAGIYDPNIEACFKVALDDEDEQVRVRAARYLATAEWLDLDQWLDVAANEPTPARYVAARSIIGQLERAWNITKGTLPKVSWEQLIENPETLEQFRSVVRAWQEWASENLRFSSQFFDRDRKHWLKAAPQEKK